MNMRRSAVTLALLLAGPLGACAQEPAGDPPLAGARIGGAFSLTDQDGRTVTDRDFAGKYRIVYFGYTFCPDVCPTDVQNIAAALKLLERDDAALAQLSDQFGPDGVVLGAVVLGLSGIQRHAEGDGFDGVGHGVSCRMRRARVLRPHRRSKGQPVRSSTTTPADGDDGVVVEFAAGPVDALPLAAFAGALGAVALSWAVANADRYEFEAPLRRASDGTYRWHLSRGRLVRDAAGSVSDADIAALLPKLAAVVPWAHIEKLQEFDGQPSYTKAQGED